MKLANRIFLFFGALFVISFVQFNAMAKCSNTPGTFCKNGSNRNCRTGCYCTGSTIDIEGINVNKACDNQDSTTTADWEVLNSAGINLCPTNFKHSDSKSKSATDCYGKCAHGIFIKNEEIACSAGNYLPKRGNSAYSCTVCTKGYYCPGVNVLPSCTQDQGRHECPDGYKNGSSGATKVTDCKNADGQNYVAPSGHSEFTKPVNGSGLAVVSSGNGTAYHCDPGQYLSNSTGSQLFNGTGSITSSFNKFGTTCTDCPAGWYCPGDDEKYQCTGKWKYSTGGASVCSTCPVGRKANSTNTGCEPATVNMESTNVVAQRVEASDLVALEATCLNGQLHKVSFLGGVNATGTMNPVYECTGETVHLPNSDFTRAGHQFDKWNCNHNIGAMAAGAEFSMPNADVNCTAQWTYSGSSYTVTYDCNGGTGLQVDPHSPYTSGYNVTVLANNSCTAPSGKTFDKWSCNGTSVTPGNQFTITENTTCKAQWKNDTDQTIHCSEGGKYWNGNVCAACPMGAYCPVNDDEKHECENNTYTNTTGNAVCTACPVGETAINNHTDCTSNQTVTCGEGKYLPAGNSTCAQCPDGYGCSGGTFEIKNSDQGRGQCMPDRVSCQNHSACCYCPDGSNPNDTYSGCVNSNGTVVSPEDPDDPETPVSCTDAGKYWNGNVCTWCPAGWYCPGNGQHYKCPFGGASTQTKASCVLNLNESQMEYNKCWLRYWNNAAAYRKCLYGIDLATLPH